MVLQQEIAEELERERKRNKKELAQLLHTNKTFLRQRDEAQRVVVHLRALIDGQTHHMQHIVRSISEAPEITGFIGGNVDDVDEDVEDIVPATPSPRTSRQRSFRKEKHRSTSLTSSVDENFKTFDGDHVTPEMERRLFNSPMGDRSNRFSDGSMAGVADRHLRDKTDAIADIIRNISDQCAAAVEGLQLAQIAEDEEDHLEEEHHGHNHTQSEDGIEHSLRTDGSEAGEGASENGYEDSGLLSPDYKRSSIPPTPDLVHNRSSTSMSINSSSTIPENVSSQLFANSGISPKVVGDDISEGGSEAGNNRDSGAFTKQVPETVVRPVTARQIA